MRLHQLPLFVVVDGFFVGFLGIPKYLGAEDSIGIILPSILNVGDDCILLFDEKECQDGVTLSE